jgi:hypothetical protein
MHVQLSVSKRYAALVLYFPIRMESVEQWFKVVALRAGDRPDAV